MKTFAPLVKRFAALRVAFTVFTTIVSTTLLQAQTNLNFDGLSIISGNDGEVGTKYRFHDVASGVDAIVTIDSLIGNAEVKDID